MIPTIIVISSFALSAVVGAVVISQQIGSRKHQLYGLVTLSFIAFGIVNYLSFDESRDQLLFIRLVMLASTLAAYLSYLFARSVKSGRRIMDGSAKKLGLATIVVAIANLTPLVIYGHNPGVPPAPIFGPGILLYVVHLMASLFFAMSLMFSAIKSAPKRGRGKYKAILTGFLPAAVLAPVTGVVLPAALGMPDLVVLSPIYTLFFVVCVGYAIIRHGLFDIKRAVIRSVAYVLVLTTLAVIYYALAYAISVFVLGGRVGSGMSMSPVNVVLALALAFLFQPVKKFFDRLTDKLFYRDSYSPSEFYDDLNSLVRSTINLRTLLNRSSELIKETLKSETVSFFVLNEKSLISVGAGKFRKLPVGDVREFEDIDDLVLARSPEIDSKLSRMLVSHRVSVAVPLWHNNALIGVMCVGEHQSSRYSSKDLQVLRAAAGELAVGIQNALSVQEIRDLNENLQQRIDAATKELRRSNAQLQKLDEAKDEFISMASHQLRTPLTSIKGYVSMIMDGDLGKVAPQQKAVLEEALTSSERMVRLIGDFLNVSRLQTGKFVIEKSPVDLATLIEHEVDSLEQNASSRNLKFTYKKPKGIPVFDIDEGKIQQVVMNFLDNAIYYSKEGEVIKVSLKKSGDMVEFTVKDSGIGVPESEQAGLFGKFFRASNARQQRPDGTGVGLFLAKKVVRDHGGEIIFLSKEGKGSTFGFKLPIPKKYL